ncbi:hypothetical protein LTR37_009899 [Vermiconidia calcicola]|uniref:Uncharacterized protein n=1 Tax=Vermiconidia calcicola TaxID=1690605 RepID=A0ACC3N6R9_9PEZI|nr:hypothetical protein LTR37_009899 [Vermiconidia calcicola]
MTCILGIEELKLEAPKTRRARSRSGARAIRLNLATHPSQQYQIYPKPYFDASPTWFTWNSLTASDVHELREERGFEGQHVYFHLNHPIQLVRLVGLIVDIEVTKGGKYILLSLDDSSGACIEVKTEFRGVKAGDHAGYPSNTVVDNLDVHITFGHATVQVDKQPIDIGSVIKVKGKIDSYRQNRQLKLERIFIVKDTNAEAKAWAETAQLKRDVLSKPWVLTKQKREEIDVQMQRDAIKKRELARKRKAWSVKHVEKHRRHAEKSEERRVRKARELDDGALKGSDVLP